MNSIQFSWFNIHAMGRSYGITQNQQEYTRMLKNEYFIDTNSIMIELNFKILVHEFTNWLNIGTSATILVTDKILLKDGGSKINGDEKRDNSQTPSTFLCTLLQTQ